MVLESQWPSGKSSTRWRKLRNAVRAVAVFRSGINVDEMDNGSSNSSSSPGMPTILHLLCRGVYIPTPF